MSIKKRCCFAGHSKIYDASIKERLTEKIAKLIEVENVKEFWVGNYGDFDRYSASAVRELKKKYPDIKLELVIPYITKSISEYKEMYYRNFDTIIMADIPENTPKRLYISKTNEYMVNKSDFIVCYITHLWGGAAQIMKYAVRKNIGIVKIN